MNVLPVYLPAIGSSDLYDYAIDDLSEMIDVMEPASYALILIPTLHGYLGGPRSHENLNTDCGIMLLLTFDEIFEILVWNCIEPWWKAQGIISNLQGACKKGYSCLHSALILQEALAMSMENNNNCIVAYSDVTKAFDTVWINGLFFRIYQIGIRGQTWCLLYKCD